jgi:hypothetical protein
MLMGEESWGVDRCRVLPLADVHRALFEVQLHDGPEFVAACLVKLLARTHVYFLDGKAVAMDRALLSASNHIYELETCKAAALVKQFLGSKVPESKVLPPDRLGFAAVPLEQVRKQPPPLLLVSALENVNGDVSSKPQHECSNLGRSLRQFLWWLRALER